MMHRPIGVSALTHRPLATVDVFELLRVICWKSPVVISTSVLSILGLVAYWSVVIRLFRRRHKYSRALIASYIFDWLDIYWRRFDGAAIYFLKSDLKFFDDAFRRLASAYTARQYADRPIRRCIINLHRNSLITVWKSIVSNIAVFVLKGTLNSNRLEVVI